MGRTTGLRGKQPRGCIKNHGHRSHPHWGLLCPHVKLRYKQKRQTSPQIQAWVTATAMVCLFAEAALSIFYFLAALGPGCRLRVLSS